MKKAMICLGLMAVAIYITGCDTCDTCDPCGVKCYDDQPPAVPTGVASITGDEWVYLYWNPVIEEDLAGYGVYRSLEEFGLYQRIGDVEWDEPTEFYDYDVTNGVTYYYAVDSYDLSGNESALSYETVDDTPRPEGWNLQWFTVGYNADESAIAIRPWEYDTILLLHYDDPLTQYYLTGGGEDLLRIVAVGGNEIQDYGYTEYWEEIGEAPTDGWSSSSEGVEVISRHTYIVRTADGYFGKIRVTSKGPNWIIVQWAFQSKRLSTELSPRRRGVQLQRG